MTAQAACLRSPSTGNGSQREVWLRNSAAPDDGGDLGQVFNGIDVAGCPTAVVSLALKL